MSDDGNGAMPFGRALWKGTVEAATRPENGETGPGIRTVAVAFFANLIVALAKYGGFLLVRSSALLAEAFHSTATTTNQALLLYGRLAGKEPEDPQHPFGHGRARYFWAFVVAVVMFGIGATLSIGRGVLALLGPAHGIATPWVPLTALSIGVVADGASFVVAFRQARQERGEHGYLEHLRRSKDPEVVMVFMEDLAALLGLGIAFAGVGLTILTGSHVYDAVASILIGVLLAAIAAFLAFEMRSLILGEAALPEHTAELRAVLEEHPAVEELVYLRTLHLGPRDLLVEARVTFRSDLRAPAVADAIEEVEDDMRARVGIVRLVSVEPGSGRSAERERPAYHDSGGAP